MHGNERARRTLIAACLLSLAADAFFPRKGPGAEVISASFWFYSLAIVAFAVRQLVLRRRHGPAVPVLKWCLLALCVVSLFASASLERGTPVARTLAFVSFGACLALVILAVRDGLHGVRARRVASSPPYGVEKSPLGN